MVTDLLFCLAILAVAGFLAYRAGVDLSFVGGVCVCALAIVAIPHGFNSGVPVLRGISCLGVVFVAALLYLLFREPRS